MDQMRVEMVGLAAQVGVFVAGLVVSVLLGMGLARVLNGPGGLLIATVVSTVLLLAAAGFSQTARDRIVDRALSTQQG
jgi:high-affinity Fe2+/Pb2+ permease